MNNADLIKTVRGLDQNGPGDNGENLKLLWDSLTASSNGQFHACEEIALRWLLKSMNGSSEAAETLRRYPLTWSILDCVFRRIPLFPLAKSFADRKFVAVLQQTLKDLARPTESAEEPAAKRKRSRPVSFSVGLLKSRTACLETAQVVFTSIKTVLDRIESTAERFSRDRIGAEHVKSLFCTSAADTAALVAPALQICEIFVNADSEDSPLPGPEGWIKTISTIWNLHLQGPDDAWIIATHVFRPASIILARLGAFKSQHRIQVSDNLRQRWLGDLQSFMRRNFALLARAAFIKTRDMQAFITALETCKAISHLAVPALFSIASDAAQHSGGGGLRKDNVEWIKETFRIGELDIRRRPDRNALMESILELALERCQAVAVDDLRRVCREYALQNQDTTWSLVAKIARCDTDVFHLSEEGVKLRQEICERISNDSSNDENAITETIEALRDGFRTRRDLPGFLLLWFKQLCTAEQRKLGHSSPWFTALRAPAGKASIASVLESDLSPKQLKEVLTEVKEIFSHSQPEAIAVFTSTIAQAIRGEPYIDATGRQLFDMLDGLKGSSPVFALRWRVVSSTLAWVDPSERADIWNSVKKRLKKIAENSPILSAETFEVFKCCFNVWDMFSPDEPHVDEPRALVAAIMKRFSFEASPRRVVDDSQVTAAAGTAIEDDFSESCGYQQYVTWIFNASSRFERLWFLETGEPVPLLTKVLASPTTSTDGLATIWNGLLQNDVNVNQAKLSKCLVDRLITSFVESRKEENWPSERGQMWMKVLSCVPSDAFDRIQRERIMMILAKHQPSTCVGSPSTVHMDKWKLVLSLSSKIMKRSTFYEGISFGDLAKFSQALSTDSVQVQCSHELLLELMERFFRMALIVLKQMAEHIDERSIGYFREAASFVASCDKQLTGRSGHDPMPALHILLLKSLVTALAQSANVATHEELKSLMQRTRQTTSRCIVKVMALCASDPTIWNSQDVHMALSIFAAIDAASVSDELAKHADIKALARRKLEEQTKKQMRNGDLRAWKIQIFLDRYLCDVVGDLQTSKFDALDKLPSSLRGPFLKDLVEAVTHQMDITAKYLCLRQLLNVLKGGHDTDGQLLAIEILVHQILDTSHPQQQSPEDFNLGSVHSDLMLLLLQQPNHETVVYRILQALLEKGPQHMSQWNIEVTLGTVARLASTDKLTSYSCLCKLVEVVVKKHRLRLEGHFHIVLSTLQALLRSLIKLQKQQQQQQPKAVTAKAQLYARLITLICEPTAGAVSRGQLHGSLDTATDVAKRSAGRHMYLILVGYVKLQLEANISTEVRDALEPAVNAIFDITPAEGRKILNDAMDASGRAILREMFKRYVKFGKWSGI